ncbi:MAG: M1 family metallopeptidase [Flavobacteriales bacterium]|nr:M1 family metallopeptidase [Flavobacteriales bacterium]
MLRSYVSAACALLATAAFAQDVPRYGRDKFRQLDQELPTPNEQRTASGAPGHAYWQMKADYDIHVEVIEPVAGENDGLSKLVGRETITYHNQSPDKLSYLWLQLDQNIYEPGSDANLIRTGTIGDSVSLGQIRKWTEPFDGGFKITSVTDASGGRLKYTINKTMMRIDLPRPLAPGATYSFKIGWWNWINDREKVGGRSGLEYFPEEDNFIYTIAQFYPRMCAYMDYSGWMHKQFLGSGEFTLDFGDYTLSITVPADHIVASTGVLQNEGAMLSAQQRTRLAKARTATAPVFIVTQDEAEKNERKSAEEKRSLGKKTWTYKATNVRDVAFASSRKFIWDGMGQPVGKNNVLCMSFYPKEGNPLWEQYSTKVVAHTIKTYSKYTTDYIYPVAQSVHTRNIGMEYPMISFNGGRPEKDGTYSDRAKYGMIGVIIHEVGHNFFPMIINSDERQWTWMDEGLNTFVQYLTEQEWDKDYPSWRGIPRNIVDYMKGDPNAAPDKVKARIEPIMTNSESITQFGNNAYGKPATALNILRETIMGRELFDHAFKTYCDRWKFKHPTPADFFRTMEDASGVDLDWFWRGWFYTTDHVDIALVNVKYKRMNPRDPELAAGLKRDDRSRTAPDLSRQRNIESGMEFVVDRDPATRDFYNSHDELAPTDRQTAAYERWKAGLKPDELALLQQDLHLYELSFSNIGGLVMPVILEWEYTDGTKEVERIPAEIWRISDDVSKVFVKRKEVKSVVLDPFLETADCDLNNNSWPARMVPTRFDVFKERERGGRPNPMQMERNRQGGGELKGP